jgi:signal transduction histidine kinase
MALQTIVARALETARDSIEARGQAVSLSLPAEPLCFEADPMRMAQVVDEILNNAVKYTPRGGEIAVTGYCEGGEVVLRVGDSGIGIAHGMLPRVFDLFFQGDRSLSRSEGELGVGLALVRILVDLHGGSISAHSDGPGLGSEFVVRLPAGGAVGQPEPAKG